jgi:predicted ester cyclase
LERQQDGEPTSSRTYTVADLVRFGVGSKIAVYDAAARGDILGLIRVGRRVRFSKAMIDAWLAGKLPQVGA